MKEVEQGELSKLPPDRRWQKQVYPAPIVVALIRRQLLQTHSSELEFHNLLIRRNKSPYDGHWALVGGKWDFGERLHHAIVREVKEETDLDTSFVALRGLVSERVVPSKTEQLGAHFIIFVCELDAIQGQAKEQEEGEVGWFTCAQIDELHNSAAIIPSDYAMIRSFAGAGEAAPLIKADIRAPIEGGGYDPLQLLRFDRIGGTLPAR